MAKSRPHPTFGQLVRDAREARGWSRATLGVEIGRIGEPLRAHGDTQIARLERDWRRWQDPDLVRRLIEVLELDPVEAWRATYPEVVEAVLTAVGGDRPARAAGAGVGRPADQALGTNRNTSPFVVPIGRAA